MLLCCCTHCYANTQRCGQRSNSTSCIWAGNTWPPPTPRSRSLWCVGALHPSSQSVCLYVYVAWQKHYRGNEYTNNNRGIVRRVVSYAVCVLSKECLWVCLCNPLLLLANGSVNTFRGNEEFGGCVVLWTVRVVLKKSRRLGFPRTVYYLFYWTVSLTKYSLVLCQFLQAISGVIEVSWKRPFPYPSRSSSLSTFMTVLCLQHHSTICNRCSWNDVV
jgi:hypothetical protein